jgi:hypothetical protein
MQLRHQESVRQVGALDQHLTAPHTPPPLPHTPFPSKSSASTWL